MTVKLAAAEAFGPHDPGLKFTDDIKNSPPEIRFIGGEMDAEDGSRNILHFRVTKIEDGKITIDANHILAGQDLTFVVTITEVRDPTAEEIRQQNAS